ncbi:MAG: tRNA (N(6)-L-threonylcarbamoyladenosine(37)-C(2))-methylthiotransferase MtaB [bacterium]
MNERKNITVAFKTIGCKLNQYETEMMKTILRKYGCEIVPFEDEADYYIINTCTVTNRADYKSELAIKKPKRYSPNSKVIATGCYVELEPDTIANIGCVDILIPNCEKMNIARYIFKLDIQKQNEFIPIESFLDRKRAFVKIEDGCDYTCTYCRVRLARGKARSVQSELILKEIEGLIKNGYLEIVLTGVNIGVYKDDNVGDLTGLIKKILKSTNLCRIRISSIEPTEIKDELIDLMRSEERFARHLHIPLQSGSNRILDLMGRRYTKDDYKRLILSIYDRIPSIGLGSDVMVGFPTETDDDFRETEILLRQLPFSYMHIFTYSQRPLTEAFKLNNDVRPDIKKERYERLREVKNEKIEIFQKSLIGRIETIIPESKVEEGIECLTGNYARVIIRGSFSTDKPLRVKITELKENILYAKIYLEYEK